MTTEVAQYLEQARLLRAAARNRQQPGVGPITDLVLAARSPGPWQFSTGSAALRIPTAQDLRALNALRPTDRRRASRRRAADLAGQLGIRLGPDGDATIVDISCSGVRLETSTRLQPGTLIDLEVIGMEGSVVVGARLIRTETVGARWPRCEVPGGRDVPARDRSVRTERQPDTGGRAAAASYTPRILAELLGRVLVDAAWLSNGRKLWSIFEREVCALVRAREVRIRALPVPATRGVRVAVLQDSECRRVRARPARRLRARLPADRGSSFGC